MRLRPADWGVLVGATGLLLTLFMDWYEVAGAYVTRSADEPLVVQPTGWASLGWLTVTLLALCIAAGLLLVVLLAAGVGDWANLVPAAVLFVLGPPTLLVLIIVVLLQPGLGSGLPNEIVSLTTAGWIGIACAVLLAGSGLASLHDERRTSPDRLVTPPVPRPAPPA